MHFLENSLIHSRVGAVAYCKRLIHWRIESILNVNPIAIFEPFFEVRVVFSCQLCFSLLLLCCAPAFTADLAPRPHSNTKALFISLYLKDFPQISHSRRFCVCLVTRAYVSVKDPLKLKILSQKALRLKRNSFLQILSLVTFFFH